MGKRILGLDIGSGAVKMALVAGGEVLQLAAAELPEGLMRQGGIEDVPALAKLLRATARREKLRAQNCALALPAQQAVTLRLTVADMTEKQLLLNLPYELRDYIDEAPEAYYFDYAVIGRSTTELGEPRLELLAACARKSVVRSYYELCRRAGWTLTTVVPAPVAYWNLLRRYRETHGESAEFCLADLGVSATRLYMYSPRSLEADRVMETGLGRAAGAGTRAQSALEISRALNFYAYNNRDSQLKSVWLCGSGAMDAETVAAVRKGVALETRDAAELLPAVRRNAELGALCPAAVGAAL